MTDKIAMGDNGTLNLKAALVEVEAKDVKALNITGDGVLVTVNHSSGNGIAQVFNVEDLPTDGSLLLALFSPNPRDENPGVYALGPDGRWSHYSTSVLVVFLGTVNPQYVKVHSGDDRGTLEWLPLPSGWAVVDMASFHK